MFNIGVIKENKEKIISVSYEIFLVLFAFISPIILSCILFSTNSFYPFVQDGHTVLMMDAQGQYIAFFRYFKMLLDEGDGFIYTLSKAFGGNFLSLYSYYLASPFNFLIAFFSYEDIPSFILITCVLKMAFASLNMYLLFRFLKKKAAFSHLIYSLSYGMCSYFFVYLFSPMWQDGAMILPLVCLGIINLIKKQNIFVYPLSLAYALLTSWYIGFMICVFSVLFFLASYFSNVKKEMVSNLNVTQNETVRVFVRFAILSLIGGFLAAPVWLSAFFHFVGTKAGVSFSFGNSEELAMNLETILSSFLTNGYLKPNYITDCYNYMAAFSSVPVLVFAIVFFFSKDKKLRFRLSYLILFGFYILMTAFKTSYNVLHGGATPNWFPTRYSFIFSFLVCYFAGEGFSGIKKVPLYSYIFPTCIGIVVLFLVLNYSNSHGDLYQFSISGTWIYFVSIVIAFICSALARFDFKYSSKVISVSSLIVFGLSAYSVYLGEDNVLKQNINGNVNQSYEEYLEDLEFQKDVDTIQTYDDSLYRMENTFIRPGSYNEADNDPMFYGFNGISHYSSVEKKDVMSYLEKIGFHYNGFNEGYGYGSTLSMNSYLGIKYILNNSVSTPVKFLDSLNKLDLPSDDGISFYENQYVLPLAFTVLPNGADFIGDGYYLNESELYWYDHFEYQNEIFKAMTDKVVDENNAKKDIFKRIDFDVSMSYGMSVKKEGRYSYYTSSEPSNTLTFTFEIPAEAEGNNLYFMFKDRDSNLKIYLNGAYYEMMSYWRAGIRGFDASVNSKNILKVQIPFAISNYRIEPEIYYEDLDVLNEYVSAIKGDAVSNLRVDSKALSYTIEGNLNLTNNNRYLLFTLPYEEGVSIYIDNQKLNTVKRFNIFTACDLSSVSLGSHNIKFVVKDKGLNVGLGLFGVGLAGLATYGVLFIRKKQRSIDF